VILFSNLILFSTLTRWEPKQEDLRELSGYVRPSMLLTSLKRLKQTFKGSF